MLEPNSETTGGPAMDASAYPEDYSPTRLIQNRMVISEDARSVLRTSGFTAAALAFALAAGVPTAYAYDPSSTGHQFMEPGARIPRASHLQALQREMAEYRELRDGWDGIGSVRPHPNAIDAAVSFIGALPPDARPPESTVSADGTVGWFWRSPGVFISINFREGGAFVYYGDVPGLPPARGTGVFDGDTFPEDLRDAIARA